MKRQLIQRILDRSHDLVSSARIEDAPVFDLAGTRLGAMHSVMLNKRSGQAAYALMILDGEEEGLPRAHPLPWGMLTYDEDLQGYRVDLTTDILDKAPRLTVDEDERPREIREDELNTYYGVSGAIPLPIEENDFNAQTV